MTENTKASGVNRRTWLMLGGAILLILIIGNFSGGGDGPSRSSSATAVAGSGIGDRWDDHNEAYVDWESDAVFLLNNTAIHTASEARSLRATGLSLRTQIDRLISDAKNADYDDLGGKDQAGVRLAREQGARVRGIIDDRIARLDEVLR